MILVIVKVEAHLKLYRVDNPICLSLNFFVRMSKSDIKIFIDTWTHINLDLVPYSLDNFQ